MTDTSAVHTRILDVLVRKPGQTAQEVADQLGIADEREVRKALGKDLSMLLLATAGGGSKTPNFSDEDMAKALRKVFEALGREPMSRKTYDEYRKGVKSNSDLPSAMTIIHRFNSWDKACEVAGVTSGGNRRENYSKTWTEDQITRGVALCFAESMRASHAAYAEWAKSRDDVPHQVRITSERNWSELARDAFALLAKPGDLRDNFLLSVAALEDKWQHEHEKAE